MKKEKIDKRIIEQAWALFYHWYHDPTSDQVPMFQNNLFALLKESDPNWHERLNPPALGINVADHIRADEKVGG